MLRITVEIVPYGIEDEAHEIGKMLIANNSDGDSMFGDYDFVFKSDRDPKVRKGQVLGWARNNGVWHLVAECVAYPTNLDDGPTTKRLEERL